MRVVIDTNVLIAAAIFSRSLPWKVLDIARSHGELIFSTVTFAEIEEVIFRSKFDRYIIGADRVEFVAMLFRAAYWVEPSEHLLLKRRWREKPIASSAATPIS